MLWIIIFTVRPQGIHKIKDHELKIKNHHAYEERGQHAWELSDTTDSRFSCAKISDIGIIWHQI